MTSAVPLGPLQASNQLWTVRSLVPVGRAKCHVDGMRESAFSASATTSASKAPVSAGSMETYFRFQHEARSSIEKTFHHTLMPNGFIRAKLMGQCQA